MTQCFVCHKRIVKSTVTFDWKSGRVTGAEHQHADGTSCVHEEQPGTNFLDELFRTTETVFPRGYRPSILISQEEEAARLRVALEKARQASAIIVGGTRKLRE